MTRFYAKKKTKGNMSRFYATKTKGKISRFCDIQTKRRHYRTETRYTDEQSFYSRITYSCSMKLISLINATIWLCYIHE